MNWKGIILISGIFLLLFSIPILFALMILFSDTSHTQIMKMLYLSPFYVVSIIFLFYMVQYIPYKVSIDSNSVILHFFRLTDAKIIKYSFDNLDEISIPNIKGKKFGFVYEDYYDTYLVMSKNIIEEIVNKGKSHKIKTTYSSSPQSNKKSKKPYTPRTYNP